MYTQPYSNGCHGNFAIMQLRFLLILQRGQLLCQVIASVRYFAANIAHEFSFSKFSFKNQPLAGG